MTDNIPFQNIDWSTITKVKYQGEVTNELEDETSSLLKEGMTYIVSDDLSSHRSVTKEGVKLLIIDGNFLASKQS